MDRGAAVSRNIRVSCSEDVSDDETPILVLDAIKCQGARHGHLNTGLTRLENLVSFEMTDWMRRGHSPRGRRVGEDVVV